MENGMNKSIAGLDGSNIANLQQLKVILDQSSFAHKVGVALRFFEAIASMQTASLDHCKRTREAMIVNTRGARVPKIGINQKLRPNELTRYQFSEAVILYR